MNIIDITYLVEAVHTAAHMGIDSLTVEPTGLHGIDADKIVVFKQEGQLPFGNIGLRNVKLLSKQLKIIAGSGVIKAEFKVQRYQIKDIDKQASLLNKFKLPFDIARFKDKEKARVQLLSLINEKLELTLKDIDSLKAEYKKTKDKEAVNKKINNIHRERDELDNVRYDVEKLNDFVSLITFFSGNNKFSKPCVNPKNIYIPKTLIDTQKYLIDIKKDHVVMLKKACQTMKESIFNLYATEAGVFISAYNYQKENFTIKIGETDSNIIFSHKYLTLPFVKLMDKDKDFTIGEAGLLKATLNCFDFQLLPQKVKATL